MTFTTYLFGPIPLEQWAVLGIMFLLGGFLFQVWKGNQGAKAINNGSPSKFNWHYLLTDTKNWIDFTGSLVAGYFWLRFFAPEVDFDTLMLYTAIVGATGQAFVIDTVFELLRGKVPTVIKSFTQKP